MQKVIQIPEEQFQKLQKSIDEITTNQRQLIEKLNPPKEQSYLSSLEFMERTKISRWKFDILKEQKKINWFKVGRKIYLKEEEVERFFTERPEID